MRVMVSQITSLTIVYSSVYSGADQRKHQSSASLAFVRGIHRWLVNSLHKGPVTQKMFPFDDVIMLSWQLCHHCIHGCQYDCLQWYQWCEGPGYLCGCRTLNINCHPLMILFLKKYSQEIPITCLWGSFASSTNPWLGTRLQYLHCYNALEILQSCTKPLTWCMLYLGHPNAVLYTILWYVSTIRCLGMWAMGCLLWV